MPGPLRLYSVLRLAAALASVSFAAPGAAGAEPHLFESGDHFHLRGGLDNARLRFQRDKVGRVAFLGGSITEMELGWRRLICEEMSRRFPATQFDFVNGGISSTDSTLGPFRLGRDVFGCRLALLSSKSAESFTKPRDQREQATPARAVARAGRRPCRTVRASQIQEPANGPRDQREQATSVRAVARAGRRPCRPVDLLFVEFAVNDHHNGRTAVERVRAMEGIVRQARTRNPAIDVVLLYCAEPDKIDQIHRGLVPPEVASHEQVAEHYQLPAVDLAREVTARIGAGQLTWEQFGGLHPGPVGHRLYAASIARLFDAAWKTPLPADAGPVLRRPLPNPLDEKNYERGRLVGLDQAVLVTGWEFVDRWHSDDAAGKRKGFPDVPMLVAEEPGAILKLHFEGTAVGILVVAGPDVGILEFSVNGAPYRSVDQFTQWSAGLHIPWACMLQADLPGGEHELVLRTTAARNEKSKGCAARIVTFLVN
ncbi:MAG: SGNH/GDSL hydrolase family protein [Thermoguttaceae bacterium]